MSGHGGPRPGSGRPKSAPTVKRVDPEVINAGILPLEMRLRVARHMWSEAIDAEGKITDLAKAKEAADFAEPAMPYTSGKLVAVEHNAAAALTKTLEQLVVASMSNAKATNDLAKAVADGVTPA